MIRTANFCIDADLPPILAIYCYIDCTEGDVEKWKEAGGCRFANVTWKAGQPFRGLDRIAHATFTPYYFLTEAELEKDWIQIKLAAGLVLAKV
jgi:hypothetical protein